MAAPICNKPASDATAAPMAAPIYNKPASDATTAAPMAAPMYNKSACDATTAAPMAAPMASTRFMFSLCLRQMSPTQCGNDTPVTAHRVCDVLEHRGMSGAEVGMNSLCIYIFNLAFALA